ncbi:SWIM zinc finger domain-containing protein [Natrialbaceae archaeon GCM10025896]
MARPQSFERGENYYEQNAVIDIRRRGETLQADVEGSQYEPYRVRIELDDTGIVETNCSCPYDHGGICKHRVAVLLTYIRDPDTVTQRPPVTELLTDLDRERLVSLLGDLVEEHPDLAEWIEREIEARSTEASDDEDAGQTVPTRQTAPDQETIRRRVDSILYPSGPPTRGAQDPHAAMESRVDDLRDLLAEAHVFIDAGDGETALTVLEAITDELLDGEWLRLSHDDSTAIFEFFNELSGAFSEALLTANLSDTDREEWADRLAEWADELASYTRHPPFQTAVAAAKRGWDDDCLQQALAGADDVDLWADERPWYADDLLEARLAVLEREGRTDEYLNLAQATGQSVQYATKLVDLNRADEAAEYARDHLSTPDDALTVAKTLRDADQPTAAIEVGRYGLTLNRTRNVALAEWLRGVASAHGDDETAREAAIAAFKAEPSMATYRAAREVADDDWPTVRDELLEHLQRRSPGRETAREFAEIFLAEEMIDEAIAIAEESGHYTVVEPVVEAVWDDRPEWTIAACKDQAEPIIEDGQSDRYRHAVQWLRYAGKAARAAGGLNAWREYVETIRDDHYRKYKLRPMLEELLDEF